MYVESTPTDAGMKCTAPAQEPVAKKILDYATSLAERAGKLAERTYEKLGPVMVSSKSTPTECEAIKQPREYPPFFEELRIRFRTIEDALYGIEDAISRTEL